MREMTDIPRRPPTLSFPPCLLFSLPILLIEMCLNMGLLFNSKSLSHDLILCGTNPPPRPPGTPSHTFLELSGTIRLYIALPLIMSDFHCKQFFPNGIVS